MTSHNLRLLPEDLSLTVPHGTMISEAVQSAGIYLTLPCGSRGSCGRCIVIANGQEVKSCVTPVDRDMEIEVPATVRLTGQKILTDFRLYDPDIKTNKEPRVERLLITLNEPTLEDPMSDASRLTLALTELLDVDSTSGTLKIKIEPSVLVELPNRLRAGGFTVPVNLYYEGDTVTVLSLSEGPLYGIAIDIGTTTVATALCDLTDGKVLNTVGVPNPQAEYGSDIINRIVYTEENPEGTGILQDLIIQAISASINTLVRNAGVTQDDIYIVTVGANTVMSHFLLGLPTDWLRREPYVPAATEYPTVKASDLRLPILSCAPVLVIAGISSYVGGDITAGIIATGLQHSEGLAMLVDVGTNGEMVLAGEGFMVACSSSAGPAFEGSGISCGSRAMPGAIDNVTYSDGKISYEVIGDSSDGSDSNNDGVSDAASAGSQEAVSLCGSGLISMMSALLNAEVINRSGRFTTPEKSYNLTPKVSITEDDILNLIRSKGAIYAGMRVMVSFMELELGDVSHVYVSGGFGRSLNVEHAADIGMFPRLPKECFSYEGNSSLAGALYVLADRSINPQELAASVMNLELSVGNTFMDEFTKACFLPHTDLSLFEAL